MISTEEFFIKCIFLTLYILLVIPGFVIAISLLKELLMKLLTKEIVIEKEDD